MDKYEYSKEDVCDKGLAWRDSCRECIFQVLCKLDNNWQTLFFNKDKKWGK
jgi:hypothetical protein